MSEPQAEPGDSGLREGLDPLTLLPFDDPDFRSPSYGDVRALTHQYKLTGSNVARLTGVTPRTVRKWMAPPGVQNHAPMPYAAWRLLLIETGLVMPVGMLNLTLDSSNKR